MKNIVIAAGYATRLGELTKNFPTPLLKIGSSTILGRMLEDIVLLETAKTLPKTKKAFKLQFDVGEFDMVIYDSDSNTCEVFEVKHSSQKNPKQIRFLLREDVCAATEKKYGKITAKYVLYNGVTEATADGITYKNIAEYLKSL